LRIRLSDGAYGGEGRRPSDNRARAGHHAAPLASASDSREAMSEPPTKRDIDACRRCPLWARATQGVAGRGPPDAAILVVGEQPGDEEDQRGEPFVGPAGRLLRRALEGAGLDADRIFLTNAVKHFNWIPRGSRRIHKTPAQREIAACLDWLEAEIAAVQPRVIVTLGATALQAVLARRVPVRDARDVPLQHASGAQVVATYHPSAVLRAPDERRRRDLYGILVADLTRAAQLAHRK
jgi:DNA polymerase